MELRNTFLTVAISKNNVIVALGSWTTIHHNTRTTFHTLLCGSSSHPSVFRNPNDTLNSLLRPEWREGPISEQTLKLKPITQ